MKHLYKYSTIIVLLLLSTAAFAQPNADFSATVPPQKCSPLLAQFTSAEQGTGYTHTWDFGNGSVNNGPINPSRIYTAAQSYTVKHTITGPGGTATVTKTAYITVDPSPTVGFSASQTTVCPGATVNFTDNSNPKAGGATTYYWVFGNGATPPSISGTNAAAKNPSVVYNNPGTNNVTLNVTNSFGCVASVTKQLYITVLNKPTVDFTASQTDFCSSPASVTFTPSVTGPSPGPYTYLWEYGDPSNSTSTTIPGSFTYTDAPPKQYTVKLTVKSNNGCAEKITKTNYIKLHDPVASFNGPSTVCAFTDATFTNTGLTNGATYEWDFGDGSAKVNTVDGVHQYTTSGTYTVTLKISIGGCVDTKTATITVRPRPNPTIVKTPDSACPAPQTIQFKTIPTMTSYKWLFDDYGGTTSSTSPTPAHTYNNNGQFTVILECVDQYGCKDTVLKPVWVKIFEMNILAYANNIAKDPPEIAAEGCIPLKVDFDVLLMRDSSKTYPYGVKTYHWDFGDAGNADTSNLKSPTYTYTSPGYYYVFVDVLTNNGCTIRDSLIVRTGQVPIIDSFKAIDTVICPKSDVLFIAHVRGIDTMQFTWDFGDKDITTVTLDSTVEHKYSNVCVDKYDVSLTVSHNGCHSPDTMVKKEYIEVLPPCANFVYGGSCDTPLLIHFVNKSKGDSSVLWRFHDGNTSTLSNPSHLYTTAGKFPVWLIAYNSLTNCKDSIRKFVTVGPNPVAVVADKTELCIGDSVQFGAYLTLDTSDKANFDWYLNGTKVKTGPGYKRIFITPGVYTIQVTSEDQYNCPDTITKTDWITVGGPTAGFVTADSFICNPDTVNFTDLSYAANGTTIARRFWYMGETGTDTVLTTSTSVKKVYSYTGSFDVKLIVTDNLGCKDSITLPKYINSLKPVAGFTVQSPVCVGGEAEFGDISTNADKYRWFFGDGSIDTVQDNPKHIYNAIGSYNTQLIVTDTLGCKDTSAVTVVDATKPIANYTMSDSIAVCPPLIVSFDGSSSIRSKKYEWNFDDGTSPGTKKSHVVVYNDTKEYNVKLIVTDSLGCTDSITKTVQVLGYAGALTYTNFSGCAPLTVDFTSLVKGKVPTMIWDFGDGNTLVGSHLQPKVSYTYLTPGRYIPRMIFNNNIGCNISSDGLDTILVDGVTADFETGPACQFSQIEFINKSKSEVTAMNSFNWTFHDGSFSALKDPKRNYGPPGKYKVKLRVKNVQGCVDSIERDITVNVPKEVDAGADTIICLTDSVQLNPSGGVSYLWSPGATLSCTQCTNPFAFPPKKTIYTVISTDVNGCHDTGTAVVDIKTHVLSIVGEGGEICDGESITLDVSGAESYLWSPSSFVDDTKKPNPVVTPNETTDFRVIAYEGSCIPDTSYVNVLVHPKPTVSIRGEQTIVAGTSADLLASGENIVRFLWSPVNTLSCEECSNPIASPYKTTVYQVKVFTIFDCVDSAEVKISVLCDESQLFIPNTFTPNGDGVNDIFMVRGSGISTLKAFRVYNRWGEVMFEKTDVLVNDKASGWDGNFKGAQLPPDVYVYTVEAYCENGDLLKLKGDVTIIR